jgi:membrane-associated phospholipid phosphatase
MCFAIYIGARVWDRMRRPPWILHCEGTVGYGFVRSWKVGVLVVLAVAAQAVAAQAAGTRLDSEYFTGILPAAGYVLARPLSWGTSDWLKFSAAAAVAASLADEEVDIQAWVEERRTAGTARAARVAGAFGNGAYSVPALALLYSYGHFAENARARRTALLGLKSLAITGLLTETIKRTTHKHRPSSRPVDDIAWDGPQLSRLNRSFPSGHSAAAFAVATVVASEYGDHTIVRPLAYSAASLCALSRVHDGAHWLSDVIIGSLLGHLTARAVIGLDGGSAGTGLSVTPVMRDGEAGLSMSYRF